MKRAHVLTSWAGDGTEENPYRPQIALDHRVKCTDITHQPCSNLITDPNLFLVEIECTEEVFDDIMADNDYDAGVLWDEDF